MSHPTVRQFLLTTETEVVHTGQWRHRKSDLILPEPETPNLERWSRMSLIDILQIIILLSMLQGMLRKDL